MKNRLILQIGRERIVYVRGRLKLQMQDEDDLGDSCWVDSGINKDEIGFGICHGYASVHPIFGPPLNETDPPHGRDHMILSAGPFRYAFTVWRRPVGDPCWDQRGGRLRIVQAINDPVLGELHSEITESEPFIHALLWLVAARNGVDVESLLKEGES